MIYQYGIQKWDSYDLTKLPEEEDIESWTQSEVDAVVTSVLPKVSLEEDVVVIDDVRIAFHKIKEVMQSYACCKYEIDPGYWIIKGNDEEDTGEFSREMF